VAPYASDGSVLEQARLWWLRLNGKLEPVVPEGCRRHGTLWLVKWQGCDSKEAADACKGGELAVPRSEFPLAAEGEFYWADLLGCRVVGADGEVLGTVAGLSENRAGQLIEVDEGGGGPRLLIPLIEQYVKAVDPVARLVRVDWQKDW
jgi:16S rRNA processing protein RimM